MFSTSTRVGLVGLAIASTLVAGQQVAHADLAPQEKDVVTVGSDIQQNAFNFLADGFHELPGYNTAGNKWRFINFNSSGDDNGRSAYREGTSTVFNPTIQLRAGFDNVTRPSGGGGGLWALVDGDPNTGALIDVSRSPNKPNADQKNTATNNSTVGPLKTIRVARDRDLIAVAEDSYIPDDLTAGEVLSIYTGQADTLGDLTSWSEAEDGGTASTPIIPLYLPAAAGMRNIFLNELRRLSGNTSLSVPAPGSDGSRPDAYKLVQQNDPTVITSIADADKRKAALVPFPKGRYKLLEKGYYAAGPYTTGSYGPAASNGSDKNFPRTGLSEDGVKLLDLNGSGVATAGSPFGVDFYYHAVFRASDYQSATPWQPGSTQNWVEALFYQPDPDGPKPFVDTPAGKALLEEAGVVPDYADVTD